MKGRVDGSLGAQHFFELVQRGPGGAHEDSTDNRGEDQGGQAEVHRIIVQAGARGALEVFACALEVVEGRDHVIGDKRVLDYESLRAAGTKAECQIATPRLTYNAELAGGDDRHEEGRRTFVAFTDQPGSRHNVRGIRNAGRIVPGTVYDIAVLYLAQGSIRGGSERCNRESVIASKDFNLSLFAVVACKHQHVCGRKRVAPRCSRIAASHFDDAFEQGRDVELVPAVAAWLHRTVCAEGAQGLVNFLYVRSARVGLLLLRADHGPQRYDLADELLRSEARSRISKHRL